MGGDPMTSERDDWVRCRGCGWEGSEEATVWTDDEMEECVGDDPTAALSCPECHSDSLADHPDSAAHPDNEVEP